MRKIIRQEVIGEYDVVFRHNNNIYEIKLTNQHGGKHFAVHRDVQLIDNNGCLVSSRPLTKNDCDALFDNIKKLGPTQGLYLPRSAQHVGQPIRFIRPLDPNVAVRHVKTLEETSYTATGEKLNYHWPVFKKYQETGYGSIIRATMTNHQVCMSHCQYCSTIGRNKKDSISLEEAKEFVNKLYFDQAKFNQQHFKKYNDLYKKQTGTDIRLKGLILSGGGQPNIWPHFVEFVTWLKELDIDLGLITNGFPRNISDEIYENFKWIRLSITPEDASPFYPQGKFDLQYVPKNLIGNPNITLGVSYVYGPWTQDDLLNRLDAASYQWQADYVRLLTDCNLPRSLQLQSHRVLAEKLLLLGFIDQQGNPLKKIFHQLKYHGTNNEANELWDDGQCFLQTFNVFWDTTGHEDQGQSHCYPCDSVTVLADEFQKKDSQRRFDSSKWGTVLNTQVERLWNEPVRPFFDPREQCSSCLFIKNNQIAKHLSRATDYQTLAIDTSIKHLNFP